MAAINPIKPSQIKVARCLQIALLTLCSLRKSGTKQEGSESVEKGKMVGDNITAQLVGGRNYAYEAKLLISNEYAQDYREAATTTFSINSQKMMLLDKLLDY